MVHQIAKFKKCNAAIDFLLLIKSIIGEFIPVFPKAR